MDVRVGALTRQHLVSARALLAAGLIAGLLIVTMAPRAHAATTLNVGVGVGSGTTAGNVYAPGDVTVLVGDSVKFTIGSDEPHSVTFGNGPAGVPPPEWPATGFTGTNPPPPGLAALTGTYAGTGFLNTSLMFGKGSNATVTFTAAGAFAFLCQIHPGMSGTVNVVASGTTTTQAEADAKAALTTNAILGAEAALEASQTAQVTETERSDGTSLWNIFTNSGQAPAPQPGGGTGYLELMRFVPPSLDIQAGDTVKWTALAVHSVTFPAAAQDPSTIDPFTTPPTTNDTYDGSSLYHSGLLAAGPGVPTAYELTFPDAGSFNYICALHVFLGQSGVINVEAAPSVTIPPTDLGRLGADPPDQGAPWLAIGLLAALGGSIATAVRVGRRR
jgi:plastocyanin